MRLVFTVGTIVMAGSAIAFNALIGECLFSVEGLASELSSMLTLPHHAPHNDVLCSEGQVPLGMSPETPQYAGASSNLSTMSAGSCSQGREHQNIAVNTPALIVVKENAKNIA